MDFWAGFHYKPMLLLVTTSLSRIMIYRSPKKNIPELRSKIMLLKSYTKEIFNNQCMPGAMSVQCFAHLEEDIGRVLPYLNAYLGGQTYIQDPPSVTFKIQGKLITVHSKKIAINALKNEEEATKIIEWLKREINTAWENREEIQPSYESAPVPKVLEILKQLPRTNCRECGQTTCLVFASMIAEGAKNAEDCPPLDDSNSKKLSEYMSQFRLNL
jgi:ArsR family metal-binding transcriptional regulator